MERQTSQDPVAEAFAQLRSDIDTLLRERETSLRRSMAITPMAVTPMEHFDDDNRQEFGSEGSISKEISVAATVTSMAVVPPDTGRAEDFATGRSFTGEFSVSLGSKSQHWSKQIMNKRGSRVTSVLWNAWQSVHSCHHSMVNKLPRLVSEDSCLHSLTKSAAYEFFRIIVLIIDACVVLGELQHASAAAQHVDFVVQGDILDVPLPYLILTDFCCIVMTTDMLLMWTLEFPHVDFYKGRTKGRRWFNIIVIIEQILQVICQHAIPGGRSMSMFCRVVSQLSFLRLIKAVAEVPEIAFRRELNIEEFRIIITSIMTSTMPFLMCAGLFMIFLTTVGVFLQEGVLSFLVNHNDVRSKEALALVEWFGKLDVTVFSLFMGLFGGGEWGPMYQSLVPLNFYIRYIFLIFICFNFIAVFNIVAAAFIKVAFNKSESDRELLIQKEKRSRKVYHDTMNKIFAELDDGDGKISLAELEEHLKIPHIAAYLSILGIDTREVGKLVRLLDEDSSADINKEEFTFGCMHLKGDARSLDLAFLHREVKTMGRKVADMHKRMRRSHIQVDSSADATQSRRETPADMI